MRRTKKQILNEPNPELLYYVKPPYPILKKKPNKEKEGGHFNKFIENDTKHQVNVPCGEALEKMPVYAKLMKDLLTRNMRPKYDENIALTKECSAIIQRKPPPKFKYSWQFTIPCTIAKLKID